MATGGLFNLICPDGKQDRMYLAMEFARKWIGGNHVQVGRCRLFVEDLENSIAIIYSVDYLELRSDGADLRGGTYLAVLPRDLRDMIAPMCCFDMCIIPRSGTVDAKFADAATAGQYAELIRESGIAYPCSIWDAIIAVAPR